MTDAKPSSSTPIIPIASTSASPPAELEEMRRRPLLSVPSYGSTGPGSHSSRSRSPKLDRVPEERQASFISIEEAEEEVELDLEDQGYFVGEHSRLGLTSAVTRTSRLCRFIPTFDSPLHVCSLHFSPHLAPPRSLRPPRLPPHPISTPSPKIFPISPPGINHLRCILDIFPSTASSPLYPDILSVQKPKCCNHPSRYIARDCP